MDALVDIFSKFVMDRDKLDRAAFDAAMLERLKTERYTVADVMYDVFVAQKSVAMLTLEIEEMRAELLSITKKTASQVKAKGK